MRCQLCNSTEHIAPQCPRRFVETSGKGGMRCWACNGFGHRESECPRRGKGAQGINHVSTAPGEWGCEEATAAETSGTVEEVTEVIDNDHVAIFWCSPDSSLGLLAQDDLGLHSMNVDPDDAASFPPVYSVQNAPAGKVLLESYLDSGAARSVCLRAYGNSLA